MFSLSLCSPLCLLVLVLLSLLSGLVDGQYSPSWDSLDKRPLPQWFDDAKFGIFIHWGVYSVPAWAPEGTYAEWYWNNLFDPKNPTLAWQNKTYGEHWKYQDFAEMFKAELFEPEQWAELFKRSGARYVVPTSKHHEGFTLWPSAQSWNWNAVDVGPHRDLLGELMTAVRKAGLHAGAYYSIYEWYHPLYTGADPSRYVDEILLPQLYDLIKTYEPDILWCDGAWDHNSTFWKTPEFIAWLYNESPVKDKIVINDRFGSEIPGVHGGFYTPEYDATVYLSHKWEENSGMDIHSYGLNRVTRAENYFTAEALVKLLVRCIANNGNLLLDIGPAADGTIPTIMQERLLQIGKWLNVTGEAVYGTRIWRVQHEGTAIDNTTVRYTTTKSKDIVFAFVLEWPDNDELTLAAPKMTDKTHITMLGYNGTLNFTATPDGITIRLPRFKYGAYPNEYVWVLRLGGVE